MNASLWTTVAAVVMSLGLPLSHAEDTPPPSIPEGYRIMQGDGDLQWDADTKTLTIHVRSQNLILDALALNAEAPRLHITSELPKAVVLLRVTDGNPTHIRDKIDLGTTEGIEVGIINPAGVIVGPASMP